MKNRASIGALLLTLLLPAVVSAGGSVAPIGLHIAEEGLFRFDPETGDYWFAADLETPRTCSVLTKAEDALFCAGSTKYGAYARRHDLVDGSLQWHVEFPSLDVSRGIALVGANLSIAATDFGFPVTDHYLLTLDPATGVELDRIVLSELGPVNGFPQSVFALAAYANELWMIRSDYFLGMSLQRIDPVTGLSLESFDLPTGFEISADDAEFSADGLLWFSFWDYGILGDRWCTRFWTVPVFGEPPVEQESFSHCWQDPEPPPPTLRSFTFEARAPHEPAAVEVPTLGRWASFVLGLWIAAVAWRALSPR